MRDSVPSARYSRVCNVLRLWRIWFIPYSYHEAVSKPHGALENGSDLHVNERQKIRHYRARSNILKKNKKNAK